MMIEEYYQVAPLIVQRIKSEADSKDHLDHMLRTLRNIVSLINEGHDKEALVICKREFQLLKDKYK